MFSKVVQTRGNAAVAMFYEDQQWSFGQLDAYSNKVANLLLREGFKRGDRLYLLLRSCPAFVAIWLGAAKVSVTGKFTSQF
ncbi:unnamed protein product [Echinostoma caproni]|uniref:Long-chain-fatty-acid--CoA ligase n=1 Tax=Echinostoma caproni TaxID=27848 RepID=A0A183AY42_9TREM|nr:unnamed protein product [Echinostoma caproni]